MPVRLKEFFGDRIQVNSLLIVLCFVSVLTLSSQSAASYPTYLLAISMAISIRYWDDVFSVRFLWPVLAILLYLTITSFWSQPHGWRGVFGIAGRSLLVFFFVVAMAECQLRGQVQVWLGRALAVVGFLAAVAAIAVFMSDPPPGGRLSGLGQLDNPVVVGLIFGAVLILLAEMVLSDPDRSWKVIAWAGLLTVTAAIYLSGSRNAWMSTFIGMVVLVLAWRVRDRQQLVAALVTFSVILSVIVFALLLSDQGREWLLPRGDSFRLEIWANVFDRVAGSSPIYGLGILTPDHVLVGAEEFQHPHSMYLAVFFQGGFIGVVLFLTLIFWMLVELFLGYEQRSAKLALGLVSMALVSYLFDGHELIDKVGETWFLFWLPVGIALGMAWSRMLRGELTEA